MKDMIHQKIEKLMPFISADFITYPLSEEGKYIPFLKCWQRVNTQKEYNHLSKTLRKHFAGSGYGISFTDWEYTSVIYEFQIYPKFRELKSGSYKFEKEDWSIEEMLDLLTIITTF